MAWKEQCQIAFRCNAEALLHNRGGKGIVKVLRQLSKESGIPLGTLREWYYGRNKKSENTEITTEQNENNICPICEIRTRERKKRNGEWYYMPYCKPCRIGEIKIEIKCPHCEKTFNLSRKDFL